MPYNRQIPDAPIAGSMLPRATELTPDDILVLIKPNNQIGQRNKSLVLSLLANWLADGNMGPIKTGEIKVGSSTWKSFDFVGPSITGLYSLAAGIIDVGMMIKVGGSEWVPGTNKPSISGLYSLAAGNVDAANVAVDTLKPHSSGGNKIEVEAMLVKSKAQTAEKLSLGPTQVNGDAGVTGNLNVIGKVTMGQMVAGSLVIAITDSASVAAAEQTISEMENGRAFIILNTSTSALSFNFSGGAVVSITAKKGVWGIKVGDYSYPIDT